MFALEDIAKGTRVAYFKGDLKDSKVSGGNEFHVVELSPDGHYLWQVAVKMRKNGDGTLGIADATSYFRSCVAPDPEYDCVMSHPKKEGFMVVGHQEESGGFGIGQFVNDGASPKLTPDMDFLQASTELSGYQVGQHYIMPST